MVEQSQPPPPADNVFLVDRRTNTPIPLISTRFEVKIESGLADMLIHQAYENNNNHPLETLFMMPYTDTFVLTKISVKITTADGKVEVIETKVVEREAAKVIY